MGTPLLERGRRGIRPTPAGSALAHHARVVALQLERMRGELSEYAKGLRGHIHLIANTTATEEFLPATLGRFLSAHPNVDIDLEERSSQTTGMSPEEMRARADLCKRVALSFGPSNSEMMREVADLWHRLAADADARAANPLRPLGVSLNGRRPGL